MLDRELPTSASARPSSTSSRASTSARPRSWRARISLGAVRQAALELPPCARIRRGQDEDHAAAALLAITVESIRTVCQQARGAQMSYEPAPTGRRDLCRVCKNERRPRRVRSVTALSSCRRAARSIGAQEVQLSDDAGWYAKTRAPSSPFAARHTSSRRTGSTAARLTAGPAREPRAEGPPARRHDHERVQPRLPDLLRTQQERRYLPHEGGGISSASSSTSFAITAASSDIPTLTGGEPTPSIRGSSISSRGRRRPAFIASRSAQNGIRLVKDEALVKRFAAPRRAHRRSRSTPSTARPTCPAGSRALRSEDAMSRHPASTRYRHHAHPRETSRGVNDREIGRIIDVPFRAPTCGTRGST